MDMDEVRRRLQADRRRTLARAESLDSTVRSIVESSDLTSTDDEHDPEGATIAFEREQAAALLRSTNDHLAELDAAQARIEAGTYGLCVVCGRPVAAARLEARPTAVRCIDCA